MPHGRHWQLPRALKVQAHYCGDKKSENDSYEAILLTANVTDGNVKSVEFLVNGIKLGVVSVTDKKAQMQVAESTLVPTGSYNTVQIFGLGK